VNKSFINKCALFVIVSGKDCYWSNLSDFEIIEKTCKNELEHSEMLVYKKHCKATKSV